MFFHHAPPTDDSQNAEFYWMSVNTFKSVTRSGPLWHIFEWVLERSSQNVQLGVSNFGRGTFQKATEVLVRGMILTLKRVLKFVIFTQKYCSNIALGKNLKLMIFKAFVEASSYSILFLKFILPSRSLHWEYIIATSLDFTGTTISYKSIFVLYTEFTDSSHVCGWIFKSE